MTGTALTEAEEFDTIYKLQTLAVPTNKPVIRVDLPDKVYFDQNAKWAKIVADIEFAHRHGQPILI
jgi:preprotein translocase subunit SecA